MLTHINIVFTQSYETVTVIVVILQMKKLKHIS